MTRFLAFVLLAAAPLQKSGAAEVPVNVLMFGGNYSCTTWLTQDFEAGKVWIWGYWTGRNIGAAVNGVGGVVGHTTDQNGIIGEVQLVCQNEPSLTLTGAVSKVYKRFLDEGR
jgi:hypothetical protein